MRDHSGDLTLMIILWLYLNFASFKMIGCVLVHHQNFKFWHIFLFKKKQQQGNNSGMAYAILQFTSIFSSSTYCEKLEEIGNKKSLLLNMSILHIFFSQNKG